jgi:hypothetical protein
MKILKNIFVGFLISFLGSIPLGYLNVIGFEVYQQKGLMSLYSYLGGVVIIEGIVILLTLLFAEKLIKNKKLLKWIEGFSVAFIFLLAYIFHTASDSDGTLHAELTAYLSYTPLVIGLIVSSLNFVQIPFWMGWNMFVVNSGYIILERVNKYFYLAGTVAGTFSGMLVLILFLELITGQNDFLSKYLMRWIIPAVFSLLGMFQAYKFYRKYY